jgi:UDP-N-acetylmuramoyl-tripeptide--D-alanyl-D-alanine ligase
MTMMSLREAARLLDGEYSGEETYFTAVSTDSRTLAVDDLFVALRGKHFDGHDFVGTAQQRGACGALVSRFVDARLSQIRVPDTCLALGRLAANWRSRFRNPVIALTGSNGKTTVKEMIAAILACRGQVLATQGNLNNDIGVPLTLLRLDAAYTHAVVEMGANHTGEIAYLTGLARPDVALVNNAGPAHLEGFGSLDGVAQGKGEIFQGLPPEGVAVINRDDPYADYWSGLVNSRRIIYFALARPAQVNGRLVDRQRNRLRLAAMNQEVDIDLPLPGRHNLGNAVAAAAACLAVGASLEDIRRGLEKVQAVDGRLQQLAGPHGCSVINDTYNANPASLAAALTAIADYPGVKWLVLGDMAELGLAAEELHAQVGERAQSLRFQRLYTLGNYSQRAALAFGKGGVHCENLAELLSNLRQALWETNEKPIVLIKGSRSMRMERVVQGLMEGPSTEGKGVH